MSSDFEFRRGTDIESRLASENFDVQGYIRDVVVRYDGSAELKQHKRKVQGVAEQTAQKLKQNVYKNYELFIDTSKEISSLESEMYQLSHLLHEHEVLIHTLQSVSLIEEKGALQGGESDEKHQKHSISALLETVEGGSIVTEVPGRYLVHSGVLVELDQETFDALGLVKGFLLNDSLMFGTHIRKKRGPVHYRFRALYELDNMAIVDVKDSEHHKFAFKILMFPDSHLYQAENEESKRQWIQMLESTKQKHKETRDAAKRDAVSRTRSHTLDQSIGSFTRVQKSESAEESHQAELLTADWLKDVPETLDVYIAQREFDQAVELIGKTKAFLKDFSDSHALRDVRARLNHRITKLSEVLMKELEASPNGSLRGGPRAARRAVGLLLRLGRSAKACELFLENYRQIIQRDLDDVKMEGTTSLYITNYAEAFFTGLRSAAQEFERAFGDNDGSYSAFIVWCNKQLNDFVDSSAPTIFTEHGASLSSIADCVTAVLKECDSLNEIGMDFQFALMNRYHPYLAQALNDGRKHIREQCATTGTAESWTPLDLTQDQPQLAAILIEMDRLGVKDFRNLIYEGGIVDLSSTTISFCKMVFNFINDVFRFYRAELLEDFIDCFCDIFQNMVDLYKDALGRDENVSMNECIVGDAQFVINTVLPTVAEKINLETGVEIPELSELHIQLADTFEKKSRETSSAEPSTPTQVTRPAEPYQSSGDGESEANGGGLSDLDDELSDEDGIV